MVCLIIFYFFKRVRNKYFLFSGEEFSYFDIVKEYSYRGGVLHFFLGSSIGEYVLRLKERNLLKIDYSNTNFYPGNLMPIYFN